MSLVSCDQQAGKKKAGTNNALSQSPTYGLVRLESRRDVRLMDEIWYSPVRVGVSGVPQLPEAGAKTRLQS